MTETVLILGGTAEARKLASAIAQRWPDWRVITSLAGRTHDPKDVTGELRRGGFGGADGLHRYIIEQSITRLIDATHPFAVTISKAAADASKRAAVPRVVLNRPAWDIDPDWVVVHTPEEAIKNLPNLSKRIFLAVGRQDIDAFKPQRAGAEGRFHLLRFVDGPDGPGPWPVSHVVSGLPGDEAAEGTLLDAWHIDTVITKNSGGAASLAKLKAAKARRCAIIVIDRPALPPPPMVSTIADALDWLARENR